MIGPSAMLALRQIQASRATTIAGSAGGVAPLLNLASPGLILAEVRIAQPVLGGGLQRLGEAR
jgi:hypothetical protein